MSVKTDNMDEKKILKKLGRGDANALAELLDMYQDFVYTIARRMVKQKEAAEEITQDVFVKVYYKLHTFKKDSKFSTWLYTIVYRTCLNYLQKKSRLVNDISLPDKDDGGPLYDERAVESWTDDQDYDRREILWQAVDKLKMEQGLVITLYYLQQLSVKETAKVMSIPENTVKTHLARGRNNLKQILLNEYLQEDLI